MQTRCAFCRDLVARDDAPWNVQVARIGPFLLTPTKGALLPGWLLITTARHVLCMGALEDSELQILDDALDVAKALVTRAFGPATIFEHGPSTQGTALGCGIDHAHIHVAALPFSLERATRSIARVEFEDRQDLRAIADIHRRGLGYLLVREPQHGLRVATPLAKERQLFRRAIAGAIGSPETFDYAAFPYVENVHETLRRMRGIRVPA